MTKLNIYLTLPGNARQALEFYEKVFGIERDEFFTYKDMQFIDENSTLEEGELVAHSALKFSNITLMIGDDMEKSPGFEVPTSYIVIMTDSREEADRIFAELSEDGKVEMPLADQPWGMYDGKVLDKFGTSWEVMLDE